MVPDHEWYRQPLVGRSVGKRYSADHKRAINQSINRFKISQQQSFAQVLDRPVTCCHARLLVSRLLAQVRPGDVITRSQANGSVEVLAEIDRVKDLALRQTTPDGK